MNQKSQAFNQIISKKEIAKAISELADCLNEEYAGGPPVVFVAVLKGAVCFLSDLIRQLNFDVEISFIQASSYGSRGTERGELTIQEITPLDIRGKDVIIIDDIFDSGTTLEKISSHLKEKNPKSLKTAVLLSKKIPRQTKFEPDYSLFEIEDHFVIGYGLDYKEYYRNLPDIYELRVQS